MESITCPTREVIKDLLPVLRTEEDFLYYKEAARFGADSVQSKTISFLETCGANYPEILTNWGEHVQTCERCSCLYSRTLLDSVKATRETETLILKDSGITFDESDNDSRIEEQDYLIPTYFE